MVIFIPRKSKLLSDLVSGSHIGIKISKSADPDTDEVSEQRISIKKTRKPSPTKNQEESQQARREKLRETARELLQGNGSLPKDQQPSEDDFHTGLIVGIKPPDLLGKTRHEVGSLISRVIQAKAKRTKARTQRAKEARIEKVSKQSLDIVKAVKLLGVNLDHAQLINFYRPNPRYLKKDLEALTTFSQTMKENNNNLYELNLKDLECLSGLSIPLQELIVGKKNWCDTDNPKYVVQKLANTQQTQELSLFTPGNIIEITRVSKDRRPNLIANISIPPGNQALQKAQDFLHTQRQINKPGFVYNPSKEPKYVVDSVGYPKSQKLTLPELVFYTKLKKVSS